ncbi:unnamed protein product [Linum trigynum]|uniref:Uncharacterized protein n=1 Tax=Linum trigynum TaxID=586398 RepID=A0AAV2DH66_9ROSI
MEGGNGLVHTNGASETEEAYYRELLVSLLEEPPQVDHRCHGYDSQRLLCLIQSLEAEINSAPVQSPMDFATGQEQGGNYGGEETQLLCPPADFSNSISWNDDLIGFSSGSILGLGYEIDHREWNTYTFEPRFESWIQQLPL